MFSFFNGKEKLRYKAWKQAKHPVMVKFLAKPFPSPEVPWDGVEIVSLDLETTGLNPATDQILSYGKVHIRNGNIHLATAKHELVKSQKLIPESSAVIHHITDDVASSARPLEQVLPDLLDFLWGKVMLVHFNKIEQGFLNAACQRLYGSPFIIPTIDTLNLSERVLVRRNHAIVTNQLRLFNLRERFNLPAYKAHNALNDAMTTAELFLLLEGEINPHGATPVTQLLV
jgi:DNA polymerase-3 subunit epsilon